MSGDMWTVYFVSYTVNPMHEQCRLLFIHAKKKKKKTPQTLNLKCGSKCTLVFQPMIFIFFLLLYCFYRVSFFLYFFHFLYFVTIVKVFLFFFSTMALSSASKAFSFLLIISKKLLLCLSVCRLILSFVNVLPLFFFVKGDLWWGSNSLLFFLFLSSASKASNFLLIVSKKLLLRLLVCQLILSPVSVLQLFILLLL